MTSAHTTDNDATTRRRVIKHVAWSVPVIAVAAAAPAHAASGRAEIKFEFYQFNFADYDNAGRPGTLVGSLSLQNSGGPTPTTVPSIAVTLTFPATRVGSAAPVSVSGLGWTYQSNATSGGTISFVFVWTGTLAPNGSTSQLGFKVALADNSPGSITSTASASGGGGTAGPYPYTQTL